jgi:hypothetical protein
MGHSRKDFFLKGTGKREEGTGDFLTLITCPLKGRD